MSELGTVLTVTQTLFAALDCSILQEVLPAFSYKSDLKRLKETVKTVENVLLDAQNKVELTKTESDYLQKLKDAVYDADDLFDKFFTLVDNSESHHHQLPLAEKVRNFFSSRNPLKVSYSMSRNIRKIRNKLNAIADDHAKFGFSVDPRPLRRVEETHSYVHADDVVGREGDATNVIRRLLDSKEDIGFLSIVGVGGVGKTTLAKVVLGDERIKSEFPVRVWVSVSDQAKVSDFKDVLLKILASFGCRLGNIIPTEYVQSKLQSKLRGKKFLLVLDDVWSENLLNWQNIRYFLMIGGTGSRVIVTTRSRETANIIGNDTYELEGLSKENAWRLFEMTAFTKRFKDPELVKIGEKIVENCCRVPLAIKVVGSLLNGKPVDNWQAFETNGLAGTSSGRNEITSVLKFSYDHLEPSLKNCFAYCALFPKSCVINKEMLMNLWEAQGYVVPSYKGQSIESACEEHFSVLLQRCFFSDVQKDEFGDVESFKIHDLMHDLAQNVSGTEICVMNNLSPKLDQGHRHVFDTRQKINERYFEDTKLRSYLMFESNHGGEAVGVGNLFKNWMSLRALAFNFLYVDQLPNTLGDLLHLRYLNLANSEFLTLPDSITNLHNLRSLDLRNCRLLAKWPREFTKLANLTHLYIEGCQRLSCMPYGMHKLRNLRVLDEFVVQDEYERAMPNLEQLGDLKALVANLKGKICIKFHCYDLEIEERYKWERFYLKEAKHLKKMDIHFALPFLGREKDEGNTIKEEVVMDKFQPHRNLREFNLWHYNGEKIGRWGRAQDNWATVLPNLVHIRLTNCKRLQQLPSLSKMSYLKSLHLNGLEQLEYMEEDRSLITVFFPSLESLEICGCVKLKGWWSSVQKSNMQRLPAFPRLSQVTIIECPYLTSFPHCLSLQTLSLQGNNKALRITAGKVYSSSSSSDDNNLGLIAELDRVDYLKSLSPQLLTGLYLSGNFDMKSLSEGEEVFKNCSSSLLTLEIQDYSKLESLRGGLEHLTALNSLAIEGCTKLKSLGGALVRLTALQSLTLEGCNGLELEDTEGMPWKSLRHNLRRLKLGNLNVEILPVGLKYLTSLEHLHITGFKVLKALPKWICRFKSLQSLHIESCGAIVSVPKKMKTLKSLQKLKIYKCPHLKVKCDEHWGKQRRRIKHIPRIEIG
ncbi:hypothetical protein RND81_09G164100 [Saponaria officinalis]|uniref:Uncharacterized protein n=1 Tax=Saponaria officinalis TaxID=3572 RepID=A0AAW1INK3_SAPOF